MKNVFNKLAAVAALMFVGSSAQAALIVNPLTGASGIGSWTSPGGVPGVTGAVIDLGGGIGVGDGLSITVGGSALVDFAIADCCVWGDAFGLKLDGVGVAWTSVTNPGGVGGLFSASITGLALTAGTHLITAYTTADCCGYGHVESWTLSAARRAPAPVPEPATLALFGLGLLGVAASRRRKV